jgi:hypothetical protein
MGFRLGAKFTYDTFVEKDIVAVKAVVGKAKF